MQKERKIVGIPKPKRPYGEVFAYFSVNFSIFTKIGQAGLVWLKILFVSTVKLKALEPFILFTLLEWV